MKESVLCGLSLVFGVSLLACGPAVSGTSTTDAGSLQPEPDGSLYSPPDAGPPLHQGCVDWRGNTIGSDQGPHFDDDGDCFCETAPCTGSSNPACGSNLQGGDCSDCDPTVNPAAIEVNGDNVDNNCDGLTDSTDPACNGVPPNDACEGGCDVATLAGSANATDFAKSIGLCNGEVVSAVFVSPSNAQAHAIVTKFGTDTTDNLNIPSQGATMVLLSTGKAGTGSHDSGTDFGNTAPNPDKTVTQACGVDPNAIILGSCSQNSDCKNDLGTPIPGDTCVNGECRPAPPDTVNDYTELKLTLKVPSNAHSFSYAFQYYSSEYPTYRCSEYNDTFLAELTSKAFNNGTQANISFDANNHVVSVDNGFFQVCAVNDGTPGNPNGNDPQAPANQCLATPAAATVMGGTGFNPQGGSLSRGAGATLELRTQNVPVEPGETITLRFIIFDEGDGQLDSSVLLDNFRWSVTPASGPVTNPCAGLGQACDTGADTCCSGTCVDQTTQAGCTQSSLPSNCVCQGIQ
jgi:hypothetical protein